MITIAIGIVACLHFFMEAKKREESSVKWSLIAFATFFGPPIFFSWVLSPFIVVVFQKSVSHSAGIHLLLAIFGVGVGFYFLVVARKALYRKGTTEKPRDLTIRETEEGQFEVEKKLFSNRKDAEEYATFMKSAGDYL